MSKHSSAEDKLHVAPSLKTKNLPKHKQDNRDRPAPITPPVGTNSKNQFR